MVTRMEQLQAVLESRFNATLAVTFNKRAYFDPTMDFVEYVIVDAVTVSDRIDEYLTLIYASDGQSLVGFRLKGFRYVFNDLKLKNVLALEEADFLRLTKVIEHIVTLVGDEFFGERKRYYQKAFQLAQAEDAKFDELNLLAA